MNTANWFRPLCSGLFFLLILAGCQQAAEPVQSITESTQQAGGRAQPVRMTTGAGSATPRVQRWVEPIHERAVNYAARFPQCWNAMTSHSSGNLLVGRFGGTFMSAQYDRVMEDPHLAPYCQGAEKPSLSNN